MAGRTEFNRAKFKELVLYLSQKSANDEGFGLVKLNKLLYRADFEAYRTLGASITGATYERQDYGPVARELPLALDELAKRGYVIWHRIEKGPHTQTIPSAAEGPDLASFSPRELAVADAAVSELADFGGKQVSDWSHEQSAGWKVSRNGEEITYETAVVSTEPIDDDAIKYFRRLSGLAV